MDEHAPRSGLNSSICTAEWPSSPCLLEPGTILAERYRLVERLGQGGMGVVFLAEHIQLGSHVAIKLVRTDRASNSKAARQLLKEARITAKLQHDSIAQILDVGEAGPGRPFFVMEYVPGITLARHLEKNETMTTEEALQLILQACSALEEAHAESVFHRDLKPQNLMLSHRRDGLRRLKILDFGIARREAPITESHDTQTNTGSVGGTPHYMAPEVARGEALGDEASDTYALGAILFELLSGQKAHPGESRNAVLYRLTTTGARRLSEAMPTVDPLLSAIVDDCLLMDPNERIGTPAQLTLRINKFTRGAHNRVLQGEAAEPLPQAIPSSKPKGGRLLFSRLVAALAFLCLAFVSAGLYLGESSNSPPTSQASTPTAASSPSVQEELPLAVSKTPDTPPRLDLRMSSPPQSAAADPSVDEPLPSEHRRVRSNIQRKLGREPSSPTEPASPTVLDGFETENPYQ